jgi:alcohol dehydrogenase class IV
MPAALPACAPHLKDIPGVNPAEFDQAAQGAVQNVSAVSQPRETSRADYKKMFEEAYKA